MAITVFLLLGFFVGTNLISYNVALSDAEKACVKLIKESCRKETFKLPPMKRGAK